MKRIGYNGNLFAESFDWMFEHEAILAFLEWFCDSIHAQNFLSDEELESFEEVVASGKGILEGENLVQALKSMQALETGEDSEDDVREEMEFMMEEKQSLENRLETLIKQRNKMSILSTELNYKLSKINDMEDDRKSKYKACLEKTHSDNAMVNTSIHNVVQSVKDFSQLYDLPSGQKERSTATFVSQLSLDDYHGAEEVFTNELTKYTKKQFFEGIAELANGSERSRYTFLEISDPTTLLIKGEAEEVTAGDIKELKRLQSVYPSSEIKRIHAQARNHGLEAAITHAREKLYHITNRPYAADVDTLRQSLQETQHAMSQVRQRTVKVTSRHLSPIVQELGKLQANKILRGDYDLKIVRQDYFISKQDQVINQLMLQRSRYEFLSMVLEVEAHKLRDSHHLLSAVHKLLERDAQAIDKRHNVMSDPLLQDDDKKRETIDHRDSFLTRLSQLLALPDDQQRGKSLFVTYDELQKMADQIKSDKNQAQTLLLTVDSSKRDKTAQLEKSLRTFENLVYGGSATSGGLPQLSTQALSDGLNQLDEVLTTLENSIRDVIKDCESKKRVLRADSLQTMERELFVFFFTDPARLKRTVADLTARVEAQIVSVE